jgi:hypothetical protein
MVDIGQPQLCTAVFFCTFLIGELGRHHMPNSLRLSSIILEKKGEIVWL